MAKQVQAAGGHVRNFPAYSGYLLGKRYDWPITFIGIPGTVVLSEVLSWDRYYGTVPPIYTYLVYGIHRVNYNGISGFESNDLI